MLGIIMRLNMFPEYRRVVDYIVLQAKPTTFWAGEGRGNIPELIIALHQMSNQYPSTFERSAAQKTTV